MRVIKSLIGPVMLLVLAAALVGVGYVLLRRSVERPVHEFTGPGVTTVQIDAPGQQFIWHDHHLTPSDGMIRVTETLPLGTIFTVTAPDGRPVSIESASGITVNTPARERTIVAGFDADIAGPYEITVAGLSRQRHFSVFNPDFGFMAGTMFGFTCAAAVVGGTGIIWGVIALVRRLTTGPSVTGAS